MLKKSYSQISNESDIQINQKIFAVCNISVKSCTFSIKINHIQILMMKLSNLISFT